MMMRRKGFTSMLTIILTAIMIVPASAHGNPTNPPPFKTVLTTGWGHSLFLKADDTLWAWGDANFGQFGNGPGQNSSAVAVQNTLVQNIIDVSAGDEHHNLALRNDGIVFAWGTNGVGQLGDGMTYINRNNPVQVNNLTDVIDVEAGFYHSLALKSDGTVWAWGSNIFSELGDGTTTTPLTPVQVSGLSNVSYVSAGSTHSLAIKSDGTVWAWGNNTDGQFGDGTTTSHTTPVQIPGLSNVKVVEADEQHSFAIKNDGTLWAWGYNDFGQLGDGTTGSTYLSPVQVAGLSGVTAVSASGTFTVAQKSDGTVWAWGHNYWRELGDGTRIDRYTPVQVTGL
ncbi:RCC1 repeat- and reductase domain-containing protein [Paenibacillus sp. 5J-6]|uniref:RCC1 repeat-and reductase domain-containing protein n=1 Tax=Paenibacillus silvestris TaxID=2606219 RepID=A0A6L8UYQ8_9BACL|nr:RCC1 repeat- and reductase domain-containing protein [Paenibacillus silvestris]MZQ82356.1 RCC1 repeat- and reductase domain-containing protein [Paenibacillus silvestris]